VTLLADALLYPSYSVVRVLRYGGNDSPPRQDSSSWLKSCVELIGVEPTTSSLQSWRSTN
jgi:hypothetical protein